MAETRELHHERVFLAEKSRLKCSDLCLSRIVDCALWLSELEERLLLVSVDLERLREAVRSLGVELGLDS